MENQMRGDEEEHRWFQRRVINTQAVYRLASAQGEPSCVPFQSLVSILGICTMCTCYFLHMSVYIHQQLKAYRNKLKSRKYAGFRILYHKMSNVIIKATAMNKVYRFYFYPQKLKYIILKAVLYASLSVARHQCRCFVFFLYFTSLPCF